MKTNIGSGNVERLSKSLGILMRKSGELETVTLDDMVARNPKVPVEEIVSFLQSQPKTKGDFIAGRRGHPSRYVFGEAHQKWLHSEVVRAEWRKRNGLNPATGGPLHPKQRGRKATIPATRARRTGKTLVIDGVTYQAVA